MDMVVVVVVVVITAVEPPFGYVPRFSAGRCRSVVRQTVILLEGKANEYQAS